MTLAPFRSFWVMQSEVKRLFNGMVGDLLSRWREGVTWERLWAPRLEAFAREGDLVIHDDLPGVALDDVDITLEGTTLTISGERKLPAGDGVDYYLRETPSAAFRRSVVVPEGIDPDSIKARLESGVLELVLPGALAEIQPKKIALDGLLGASPPWERLWASRGNGPASWRAPRSASCASGGESWGWRGWPPRGSSSRAGLRNRRFVGVPEPVKGSFVEGPPDELHPDRQAG